MKINASVAAVAVLIAVPIAAEAQTDPLANLRGLANSVKALGRIGKKPVATTADATAVDAQEMLAVGPEEGVSNVSANALVKGDAATYDVGGIKLGMSPAEVVRVAKARRLAVSDVGKSNPSFEQAVAMKMKEMRNQHAEPVFGQTSFMRLKDDQGSVWDVHFKVTRDGPRTYLVQYETPLNGRTPQGFASSLVEKYGLPKGGAQMAGQSYSANWCATARTACANGGDGKSPAFLEAHMSLTGLRLRLDNGYVRNMAHETAITAQAQANLAKTAPKVSF